MIRILHTADWHLGARLCDQSRTEEHAAFLDWLLERVEEHDVDVLLVAGDVFDQANPPAEARALLYELVARLRGSRCVARMIAGNHDAPAVLDAPAPLFSAVGTEVVGALRPPEQLVLPLVNRDGAVEAWLAMVPYLRPVDLPGASGGSTLAERQEQLVAAVTAAYDAVLDVAEAVREPHHALIATGHLFVKDARVSDSERAIQVSHRIGLPVTVFPESVDYVALGHLHRPQEIASTAPVVYPGAPVPMSFAESAHDQTVALVDFDGGRLVRREALAVPRFRPLLHLAGTADEVLGAALALSRGEAPPQLALFPGVDDDAGGADDAPRRDAVRGDSGAVGPGWAAAQIRTDADEEVDVDALSAALEAYGYRLVQVIRQRAGPRAATPSDAALPRALSTLSPREVFAALCEERGDLVPPERRERTLEAFDELLAAALAQEAP